MKCAPKINHIKTTSPLKYYYAWLQVMTFNQQQDDQNCLADQPPLQYRTAPAIPRRSKTLGFSSMAKAMMSLTQALWFFACCDRCASLLKAASSCKKIPINVTVETAPSTGNKWALMMSRTFDMRGTDQQILIIALIACWCNLDARLTKRFYFAGTHIQKNYKRILHASRQANTSWSGQHGVRERTFDGQVQALFNDRAGSDVD